MDRIHLRARIDPDIGGEAPCVMRVLGNRLEPYFENHSGRLGDDDTIHGEHVRPFDDVELLRLESGQQGDYDSLCSWLRFNPVSVRCLRVSADRPEIIKSLSLNVWRRTPFKEYQRQWIPLAGLLDQKSENNTSLRLELPMVLDGFTCLEVRVNSRPSDVENFDIILEVEAIDDDRKRLA